MSEVLSALPVFTRPGAKTRGTFITEDGDEQPLTSGVDPMTKAVAAGLGLRRVAIAETHVEAHAAARMRQGRIRSACLVVNNEPCAGPLGCRVLLPRLLPPNAQLTVYGPNGFQATYRGRDEPE